MSIERKDKQNLRIAYIGGGSRGWAWGFMEDLAREPVLCGTVALYDIDREAAGRNQIIGGKISALPDARSRWQYEVADSLQQALHSADFVVISILPGTFDEMQSDVHAPEVYGIYQSVGDTVGPGGFIRAMRTVPMFAEIAAAIREYSPDAWVINYTNPMSVCVRTLYAVFPQIKALGCCHEVFGTQELLCSMLKEVTGETGITRQQLYTQVTGINHFTWLTAASFGDMDLFPLYAEFADRYFETGYAKGKDNNWMNNSFESAHRVKFDLFRRYGFIAAAGDRHLAEFMPPWYLKDPETVRKWKFGLTPVSWRKEDLQKRMERSDRLIGGAETPTLAGSGEEGVLLIKALLGLAPMHSNVNIPNTGQIPNLPLGAVVETNALFQRDAVIPVMAGNIPGNLHPLISRHVDNQENTVRAALSFDKKLALTTFLNDPLMTLDMEQGTALFETMMEATKNYLPGQWGY